MREVAQSAASSQPRVWGLQLFRALRNMAQAVLSTSTFLSPHGISKANNQGTHVCARRKAP